MDVKKRQVFYKEYTSHYRISNILSRDYSSFLAGHQRTETEGHPFSRLGKSSEDIGGNFQTERYYAPKPQYFDLNQSNYYYWSGPLWPSTPHPAFLSRELSEDNWKTGGWRAHTDLLAQYGTTAIARTIPTNPTFSAAAALGELREGLPAIPGKSVLKGKGHPSSMAGEYLNLEFGLKPTISDARKLMEAHKKSEKILAQLYRDSGKLVRRKKSFPPEVTEWKEVKTGVYPYGPGGLSTNNVGAGTLIRKYKQTRTYWFAGGYTYLFPRQEGWHRKMSELEKVYGIVPDAADLWQLTPWSWAVDWASNAGDLIQNMTSFSQDNLVLRFGYIMCRTELDVDETWNGLLSINGSKQPGEVTTRWRYVSKQRQRATPYGFGLTQVPLSARQLAIISALGISRGGK